MCLVWGQFQNSKHDREGHNSVCQTAIRGGLQKRETQFNEDILSAISGSSHQVPPACRQSPPVLTFARVFSVAQKTPNKPYFSVTQLLISLLSPRNSPSSFGLSLFCKRVVVADLSPVIAGLMSVTRGSERVSERASECGAGKGASERATHYACRSRGGK